MLTAAYMCLCLDYCKPNYTKPLPEVATVLQMSLGQICTAVVSWKVFLIFWDGLYAVDVYIRESERESKIQ